MTHDNITIMREKLKQKDKILNARKKHKKGKRIAVEGEFVFITKEMLEMVEEMKVKTAIKKVEKQPQKCSVQEILKDEENEVLKDENNNSDSDCIVLRPRK